MVKWFLKQTKLSLYNIYLMRMLKSRKCFHCTKNYTIFKHTFKMINLFFILFEITYSSNETKKIKYFLLSGLFCKNDDQKGQKKVLNFPKIWGKFWITFSFQMRSCAISDFELLKKESWEIMAPHLFSSVVYRCVCMHASTYTRTYTKIAI